MAGITETEDGRSLQIIIPRSAAQPYPRASSWSDLVSASASTPGLRIASGDSFPPATAIPHIQDTACIEEVTKQIDADEVTMSPARRPEQVPSTIFAETPGFSTPMIKLQHDAATCLGAQSYFSKSNLPPGNEILTVLPQKEEEFQTAFVGRTNARVGGWGGFSIDAEQPDGHGLRLLRATESKGTANCEPSRDNIPRAQGQTPEKLEEDTTPAPRPPKTAGKNKCTAPYAVRPPSFYTNETKPGPKTTEKKTKPGASAAASSKTLSPTEAGAITTTMNTLAADIADADDEVLITGATGSSTSAEAQAFRRQLRQNKRRSNKERKIALTLSAAHSWPPQK